ncbi:C40 family peptidase [Pontibacter sp. G13]|uniref:C40 family peptidase n=1 Tax=Pontibacter sp. G13 TaxID=3074898 RepID=UPI0028895DAC|nr:C40 family peptidase [Pontibacter sp. G13]WNJ21454.1 C40 family peptidase [Pontibacter sp. G13]
MNDFDLVPSETSLFLAMEAIVPMRGEAKESAEMISQLVFGEGCTRIEEQGSWSKVKSLLDGYEGWVDTKMLAPIPQDDSDSLQNWIRVQTGKLILEDGSELVLPLGARIPASRSTPVSRFSLGGYQWKFHGDPVMIPEALTPQILVERAKWFRNVPYVWGGKTGFGIDCSGFMQTLFAMCGIDVPRDSSQQALVGTTIAYGEHRAGDVAFFAKPGKTRVSHVGLLISSDQIIHASGKVRIDSFTETGIIHTDNDETTHILLNIQRW